LTPAGKSTGPEATTTGVGVSVTVGEAGIWVSVGGIGVSVGGTGVALAGASVTAAVVSAGTETTVPFAVQAVRRMAVGRMARNAVRIICFNMLCSISGGIVNL
jgi:hypothetical protein